MNQEKESADQKENDDGERKKSEFAHSLFPILFPSSFALPPDIPFMCMTCEIDTTIRTTMQKVHVADVTKRKRDRWLAWGRPDAKFIIRSLLP